MGEKRVLECIPIYYICSPYSSDMWITWVLLEAKPSDFIRSNSECFFMLLRMKMKLNYGHIWTSRIFGASCLKWKQRTMGWGFLITQGHFLRRLVQYVLFFFPSFWKSQDCNGFKFRNFSVLIHLQSHVKEGSQLLQWTKQEREFI